MEERELQPNPNDIRNKQGTFETWLFRVKLCLLQMNVFTFENVDLKVLPQYWKDLYDAELNPVEAIREQNLYVKPSYHESKEYIKYLQK